MASSLAREIADVLVELDVSAADAADPEVFDAANWRLAYTVVMAQRQAQGRVNVERVFKPGWLVVPGDLTRRQVVALLAEREGVAA